MKTTARLTYQEVRFDQAKDLHLVVSLAAPHLDSGAPRRPVCVIPVLDLSGSMRGEKLRFARQSLMKLVDHLAPGDRCGVVVFSTRVETLAAPAELTQARRDELKGLVGRLAPQHNTNREGPAKSRPELLRLLDENLGAATLSAFGYGEDADQELLRDLSTKGKGNYAFVQSPEDALTAFARELGGLLSTCAQGIELTVTPRPGFVLTDVVSDVDATDERGVVRIRIPDLLADEVRNVVLAGRLEARPGPGSGLETVADVAVAYDTCGAGRPVRGGEVVPAEVRFVAAAEAQAAPTPSLDAVVAVAQLVRAQIDAEEAVARGDYRHAREVMTLLQAAVATRGHAKLASTAAKLADRLADESSFAASAAYRASMRRGGSRQVVTLYQREAQADLDSLGLGKTTGAQARMERAFGAPPSRASGRTGAGEPGGRGLSRRRSTRW